MITTPPFDFDPHDTPTAWREAEAAAPPRVGGRLPRPRLLGRVPANLDFNAFSAAMLTIVTASLACYGWYLIEADTIDTFPLMPIVLAAVITMSIRWAGGRADPQLQAAMSLGFYLVAVLVTLLLIGRADHIGLYGSTPGLADIETELRYGRLAEPLDVACIGIGAAVAARLGPLLVRR